MLFCLFPRIALARDLPDVTLRSDPVNAKFVENFNRPGDDSFFDTTLNEVPTGFDVMNGEYIAWCSDPYSGPPPYDQEQGPVTLFSTYGALPPNVGDTIPWDKVNYLLNHKNGQCF